MAARKSPATQMLTPKQERFAQLYIELSNASEAYRRSYNAARMKAETIHVKASQLLGQGKIAVRVAELQSEHRARHSITIDSLTEDLENDRQLAHTEGQAGAAVSATLGKAKLHGLLKDKVEASGPEGGPIDLTVLWRLSEDERRALRGIATKLAGKSESAA